MREILKGRFSMEKHFTSSVYIIDNDRVLLIFHPKFQKWLPPGGHIEPNESSADAAKREVFEETGYAIEWILDEHVWIQNDNVQSLPRPFACLAQEVPAQSGMTAHQHLDFTYIARLAHKNPPPRQPSHHSMKWMTLKELEDPDCSLVTFPDTKEMLRAIFSSPLLLQRVADDV